MGNLEHVILNRSSAGVYKQFFLIRGVFCASELEDRDEEASTDGGNLSESAEVSTRNLDAAREISELRFLSLSAGELNWMSTWNNK